MPHSALGIRGRVTHFLTLSIGKHQVDCPIPRITSGSMDIRNHERRMLRAMLSDSSKDWTLGELLSETGWDDQVHVAGSGAALAEAGLVSVNEFRGSAVSLGEEGERASKEGLLEARIWDWLLSQKAEDRTMAALSSALERHEAGPGVGLLKALGVNLESGVLVAGDEAQIASEI